MCSNAPSLLRKPEVTRIVSFPPRDRDQDISNIRTAQTGKTRWTGPLEDLFGFPPGEVGDKEDWWLERIHPDDQAAVRHGLNQLLESAPKHPFAAESRISGHDYRFKHASGQYISVSDRTIVTRNSQGNVTCLESVVFDKEKRRKQRNNFAKIFEAQNHLSLIANNTQSGIFMMDPEGYCIYMNSAAEKITGFTFEEIHDYTFHASVHSCRPDGAVFPIHDCPVFCHQQAGTEAKNEPEIFVHKDGHHYDIEFSVSPIGNYATGGAVIEFRDVTEQKKVERERMNAMLINKQQSIQIKADNVHKVNMTSFVSFVCHELRNPLQGVTSSAEFLFETLQKMEKLTQQMLSAIEIADAQDEVVCSMADDDVGAASERQVPMLLERGNKSVTVRKDQHAEMQDLISYAKQLVSQVTTCAEHQALITNNVLDLSRLDAGKVELSFEIVDVRDAGRQTVQMVAAKAQHKHINLSINDNLAEPVYLKIDVTLLRQVLLNLVSNAVKFAQENGNITLEFHVDPPDTDGRVTLHSSVTDDGLGMTEAEQKNLFQRFSQANRRVAQLYGGSGLGLSICKELVRVMGGEMHVRSEKGKGSTFSFTSIHDPPSSAELAQLLQKQMSINGSTNGPVNGVPAASMTSDIETLASEKEAEPTPPKFHTIGVAEDNPINLRILATHLTMLGYQYVLCTNGQEIVDKVRSPSSEIDCCILDMSMPVMDGLEASRLIREHESSIPKEGTQIAHRMPIIALSGNALKEQVTDAMKAGISDYLVKPCKQVDLARRLAYWERIVHSGAEHVPMLDMSLRR